MQIFDNDARFGTVSRTFHWVMAIVLVCLWGVGFSLANHFVPQESRKDMMNMHKSIGVIILLIAILRLMWRFANRKSPSHESYSKFSRVMSKLNNALFYALMFIFPLSGIVMSVAGGRGLSVFGWALINTSVQPNKELGKLAWQIHGICGKLFIACFVLHILGVLYHQFILKDNILKKMLGR